MAKFGIDDWLSGTLQSDGGYSFSFTSGGSGAGADQIQGSTATGAAATGNPVAIGGLVNTGNPTSLTTGQIAAAWSTSRGAMVIGGVGFTPSDGNPNTNFGTLIPATSGNNGFLAVGGFVYNNSTWDRQRGDSSGTYGVSVASTAAAASLTPVVASAASSLVVKASAGNFYGGSMVAGATAGFLIAYNAIAAPAGGAALTAALILGIVPVAANGYGAIGDFQIPDRFSVGVTLLFSTSTTTYTVPGNVALFMRGRAA